MAPSGHMEHDAGALCPFPRLWDGLQRLGGSSDSRRARRVTLLVVALWLLNVFDLVCTLSVHDLGVFFEANPVARRLLAHPGLIITFKLGMVTFATMVFLTFRRLRPVEIACWGLLAIYVMLAMIWGLHLEITHGLSTWLGT